MNDYPLDTYVTRMLAAIDNNDAIAATIALTQASVMMTLRVNITEEGGGARTVSNGEFGFDLDESGRLYPIGG